MQGPITPNLWFDTQAEEAAAFYLSVFPNSRILTVTHYTEAGPREAGMVLTVEFELNGQRFVGINGGPNFTFDEAISFEIDCETQEELDYYWEALTDGGEESQCGWLKDRFGVSWQVVPTGMAELFADSDPERARRAMEAMLKMRKLDLAALQAAADGTRLTDPEHRRVLGCQPAAGRSKPRVGEPQQRRVRGRRSPQCVGPDRPVDPDRLDAPVACCRTSAASSFPWWPSRKQQPLLPVEVPEAGRPRALRRRSSWPSGLKASAADDRELPAQVGDRPTVAGPPDVDLGVLARCREQPA